MRFGVFVVMAGRNAGGPETYEHGLIRSLAALDQQNEYHIFCLNPPAADSFRLIQENISYHVLWPDIRWVSIPVSLPLALRRSRIDLLHATYVPPPFSPTPYVFTLLDISMFTHPELYPPAIRWRLQKLVSRALQYARLIVCISQYTQDSVAEMFQTPAERLTTVHLGLQDSFRPVALEQARQVLKQKYHINYPYLLFVGSFVPRKNIVRVVEAFYHFRQEAKANVKLVLAGQKAWGAQEVNNTIERRQLREHVIELNYVADDDLPALYSGANMLVFPSLNEGFGFPVLEAMACGAPVLTSNLTSLPEIAGGAALLVDPYSVEDIASNMHTLFSDAALRASLREKGLERAKEFTWRHTAQRTLAAYHRALAL